MVLAGSSLFVGFDTLCEAVFFPVHGLSRVPLTSVLVGHTLTCRLILMSNSSSMSCFTVSCLADRRATARTTTFVEPCMQHPDQKKAVQLLGLVRVLLLPGLCQDRLVAYARIHDLVCRQASCFRRRLYIARFFFDCA